MSTGRLIRFARHDAATNMALDQAMLESVDQGSSPSLRFYGWSRPTLSLGYFQKRVDRSGHHASADVPDCVRRASGGGAILHHHELTYSIAVPVDDDDRSAKGLRFGPHLPLYRRVHDGIAEVLGRWGVDARRFMETQDLESQDLESPNFESPVNPASHSGNELGNEPFLCFQRRTDQDLIVSGYKVLGSAQRRGKQAVLQHGSLLIRASPFAPELPGVFDLVARPKSWASGRPSDSDFDFEDRVVGKLAESIAELLGERLGYDWERGADLWTPSERQRADEIRDQRFANQTWLARR